MCLAIKTDRRQLVFSHAHVLLVPWLVESLFVCCYQSQPATLPSAAAPLAPPVREASTMCVPHTEL